jgi:hypothetical protein
MACEPGEVNALRQGVVAGGRKAGLPSPSIDSASELMFETSRTMSCA